MFLIKNMKANLLDENRILKSRVVELEDLVTALRNENEQLKSRVPQGDHASKDGGKSTFPHTPASGYVCETEEQIADTTHGEEEEEDTDMYAATQYVRISLSPSNAVGVGISKETNDEGATVEDSDQNSKAIEVSSPIESYSDNAALVPPTSVINVELSPDEEEVMYDV
jgi:hypothetical protein